jgi:1,4-dihydroxy-2-naphthoate octaprenyltransferase
MNTQISKSGAWLLASRPKTLLAAVVPVLVGGAFALADKKFSPTATFIALFCSLCIQIGTNFTNDLYDFLKGADTTERIGPIRVLNAGLITKKEMRNAILIVFGSAFFAGLYLVWLGGLPILIIGLLSIMAGYIYTAGPYPLAYNGLGDLFSFAFFGVVGTTGTYFVNTLHWSPIALQASIPVGTLITAILVVNNYRDIEQDAAAGKRTLAVKFGKRFTEIEYIVLLITAFVVPVILVAVNGLSLWLLLPFASLPLAFRMVSLLFTLEGQELNKLLELTAKFSALFGLLFSIGAII